MLFPGYPRSFRRLLAIGFALIAIPAMVALVSSTVAVTQLASRGQQAVFDAARFTQAARRLGEAVVALERNARQLAILGDSDVLEAYDANREHLASSVRALEGISVGAAERKALERILAVEAEIHAALSNPQDPSAVRAAAQRFSELDEQARLIQHEGEARVGREAEALRETAERARRIALLQLAGLLPVIAFLVVGFTVVLTRPVRQLDEAIRRLGSGRFTDPIAVQGPLDLEELGKRLEWMRTELIGLEREKNRFMREISHALKTPLTALREGTELLREGGLGALGDEQREVVEILRRHGLELQRLIEELLQYGAVQFHRTALELTGTDLASLFREIIGRQGLSLRARRLSLVDSVEPARLRLAPEKIRLIVDNLLSNAIKFSPDGGEIRMSARHRGGVLTIDVADQGPGIAPEDRQRIFDPFVQGRALPSGRIPGTGIGLSIVRECAIAHGGTVELVTGERGAWFRVTVPAESA